MLNDWCFTLCLNVQTIYRWGSIYNIIRSFWSGGPSLTVCPLTFHQLLLLSILVVLTCSFFIRVRSTLNPNRIRLNYSRPAILNFCYLLHYFYCCKKASGILNIFHSILTRQFDIFICPSYCLRICDIRKHDTPFHLANTLSYPNNATDLTTPS